MLIQLLIIVFTCVHNADCKLKNPRLLRANSTKKHEFQCPMESFVVGFRMVKERVFCRKFREEPAKNRSSEICEWRSRCDYSDEGETNTEGYKIARGLRFVLLTNSRYFMGRKRVKLYCCKQDCRPFNCIMKRFRKPLIGSRLEEFNIINYVGYERRRNTIKAEFCRPRCPPIGGSDAGWGGIPKASTCRGFGYACTVAADCCDGVCENGNCGR